MIYYSDDQLTLHHGDAATVLATLPDASVDCCVTSPPYFGLRDYGVEGQLGSEVTPAAYVGALAGVFAEVHRVLTNDGTLWLNLGDAYSTPKRGSDKGWDKSRINNPARVQKAQFAAMREGRDVVFDRPRKSLLGLPWRVAFALQDQGWILRNDIVWSKPNAMPESVKDRLAARHEYVFLFTKRQRYWFDQAAIAEPVSGRAPGDVWTISTQPFAEAHFATQPSSLAERCIQAGCRPDGVVLDPFHGSGTTGAAAARHGRAYVGIELKQEYLDLSLATRLQQASILDHPTEAIG